MCLDKIIINQENSKKVHKFKVDGKKLATKLMSLTSNIIQSCTSDEPLKTFATITKGIGDFIEIIGCCSIVNNIESLMWEFIKKSLYSATTDIIKETELKFEQKTLNWNIEESLRKAQNITVDLDFLQRPSESQFSAFYCEYLCNWLLSFINENDVKKIQKNWPIYFTNAINNVWRTDEKYRELLHQLDTPFTEHLHFLDDLRKYNENSLNFNIQNVFDEPITLKQIYVDLFGTASHSQRQIHEIVNVRDKLYHWSNDRNKDMCFVSGDPGSGKSTVMKMLANTLAENGNRVVFIDLYKLNFSTKKVAIDVLEEYISKINWLKNYDFENGVPITLILDGLDEIKVDVWNNAQELVEQLHNSIWFRRHKVIISGRKKIIDYCAPKCEYSLRIEILPIALTTADKQELYYRQYKSIEIIDENLQEQYWNKLMSAFNQQYSLADLIKKEHLAELCAFPLILFLLAWTIKYSDKSVDKIHHSVELYESIIYCVYSRKYNRDETDIINQSYSDYKKMLSITGLCAWQNNSKCIGISHIEEYCEKSNLSPLFKQWIDYHQTNNPSKLLLLFFFREKLDPHTPDDSEIEFIHKSFYEFLTALAILDVIYTLQNKTDSDFYYSSFIVFSKFLIGVEIEEFIEGLLEFSEKYDLQKYADAISSILPRIYNANWPIVFQHNTSNAKIETSNYLELRESIENIGKNFVRLAAILSRIKRRNNISVDSNTKLHIESSNFNSVNWMWANLCDNDFSDSTFDDANLAGCELYDSVFNNCSFPKANLNSCILSNSEIKNCGFISTHMEACVLEDSVVSDSTFDGAILEGGYLAEAKFNNSVFNGTNFVAANLDNTQFINCEFCNVNFERAILAKTSFSNVSFVDCVMENAKLINVSISSFNLKENSVIEMLSEADLSEANWNQVDIEDKNKILHYHNSD